MCAQTEDEIGCVCGEICHCSQDCPCQLFHLVTGTTSGTSAGNTTGTSAGDTTGSTSGSDGGDTSGGTDAGGTDAGGTNAGGSDTAGGDTGGTNAGTSSGSTGGYTDGGGGTGYTGGTGGTGGGYWPPIYPTTGSSTTGDTGGDTTGGDTTGGGIGGNDRERRRRGIGRMGTRLDRAGRGERQKDQRHQRPLHAQTHDRLRPSGVGRHLPAPTPHLLHDPGGQHPSDRPSDPRRSVVHHASERGGGKGRDLRRADRRPRQHPLPGWKSPRHRDHRAGGGDRPNGCAMGSGVAHELRSGGLQQRLDAEYRSRSARDRRSNNFSQV